MAMNEAFAEAPLEVVVALNVAPASSALETVKLSPDLICLAAHNPPRVCTLPVFAVVQSDVLWNCQTPVGE
jgi:hypothetical protein